MTDPLSSAQMVGEARRLSAMRFDPMTIRRHAEAFSAEIFESRMHAFLGACVPREGLRRTGGPMPVPALEPARIPALVPASA